MSVYLPKIIKCKNKIKTISIYWCVLIIRFYFYINYLGPPAPPLPTTTTTTPSVLVSPPKCKNAKLEQIINENKDKSTLDLSSTQLTDDCMAIVAYYLLKNNKVSN